MPIKVSHRFPDTKGHRLVSGKARHASHWDLFPVSHPSAVATEHATAGCFGKVRVRDGRGLIRLAPPGRIAYDEGAGQPPSPGPCRRSSVRRPNFTGAP